LLIVLALSFTSQLLNMRALSWLLQFITDIWVIAFIILFQPEIRRLLVLLARTPFFKWGNRTDVPEYVNEIMGAAYELSQQQHGALIIIIKSSGIRGFSETGEQINAPVSKKLLRAIFFPRSPLHDGAVVVNKGIIEAARCTLPLSPNTTYAGQPLGMRHRAGLGISEQADVISLIVSEETGSIAVAENGILYSGWSKDELKSRLVRVSELPPITRLRIGIEQFFKREK
jgi:diadenylate cyclase